MQWRIRWAIYLSSYDLSRLPSSVYGLTIHEAALEANKLLHKEGHAALTLPCPLCEREISQSVFINKTTGGLVCPPCKVHGELVHLVDKWSCQ